MIPVNRGKSKFPDFRYHALPRRPRVAGRAPPTIGNDRKDPMRVLGIETSCDETGVAVYDRDRGLLAQALYSQVALHRDYGGVVPELASRDHVRRLTPMIRQVLAEADTPPDAIDGVAYTAGPGLAGALLVGAGTARALAYGWGVPAVGVHHMEGHLLAPLLEEGGPDFPFVALLVSGGHTMLLEAAGVGEYRLLGESVDDGDPHRPEPEVDVPPDHGALVGREIEPARVGARVGR